MRIEYSIIGTLTLPAGTVAHPTADNQFILPGGQLVSVHPVVEVASTIDADDHRFVSYPDMRALDIEFEDYDRTATEVEEN